MNRQVLTETDTRCRLLRAAGPVFADHGYEGATVREICGLASVNIASVGYYFGDKQGLYREVVMQIRAQKSERFPIPDSQSHPDPIERLHAFVRMLLGRMFDNSEGGWQVRLMLREIQQPTELIEEIVRDHFSPILDQLCDTLAEIMDARIAPLSLRHLGLSVIGQCFHYRASEHAVGLLLGRGSARDKGLDIDELAVHITSVSLAAALDQRFLSLQDRLRKMNP